MLSVVRSIHAILFLLVQVFSIDTNITLERTFDGDRGFMSLVRGMYTLVLHSPDIRVTQQLTIEEAFHGVNKTIIVDKNVVFCHDCNVLCYAV